MKKSNSELKSVPLNMLEPHPQNPRRIERRDVIDQIVAQLREAGEFHPAHALLVRPLNGKFQIVSGHNRAIAAREAEFEEVPAWVREMDDETAFMELILANAQSELSPLERGIHALEATEKGTHGRSVKAYAEKVGRPHQSVDREVRAARVVNCSVPSNFTALVKRAEHLAEVHAAPEHCWPALVGRLIKDKWNVEETKKHVRAVLEVKPPRGYEKLFALEKLQEMAADGHDPKETISLCTRAIERGRADIRDVQFEADKYAAEFEAWLAEHGGWDYKATAAQAQAITDRQRAAREEAESKANRLKKAVTLAEWKTLTAGEQEAVLAVVNPKAHFLKQTTDSIEWARWSWNPVTGCEHDCPYCYARDLAERFYPQKFAPSIVPEMLSAPLNVKPPKEAVTDIGLKNVFTCSMADLFGNWVPKEWIDTVLRIMRQSPEWNFLVLTKFPQRLAEFEFPENVWVGTTVDMQARVANAERALRKVKASVKWVSIEPMIEPIEMDFSLVKWVVIGGASTSSETPEWKPPRRWVIDVTHRALAAGCAVYHKTNLSQERLRGYPGAAESEANRAPDAFHYLGKGPVNISSGKGGSNVTPKTA